MIEQERLKILMSLYQEIHNNWASKKRFEYVVIPSKDIRELAFEETKSSSFRVGVSPAKTEVLNVQELAALFTFIKDQADQMRAAACNRAAGQKSLELSSLVNLNPSDDDIRSVLSGIQFSVIIPRGEKAPGTVPEPRTIRDFDLSEERVNFVMSMVKKKTNAALSGQKGNHFLVYPPAEWLNQPSILSDPDVYERLKDTVWWVRWYDDRYEQLRFLELLIFVQQIISTKFAFTEAIKESAKHPSAHQGSKHAGGWQPKKDKNRKPPQQAVEISIKIEGGGFKPAELVKDEMIRGLLSKVAIEETGRPSTAMN